MFVLTKRDSEKSVLIVKKRWIYFLINEIS